MIGATTTLLATKLRLMEVTVTYEQDGEYGTVSVNHADYETARDEAYKLVPEGAQPLSIRVDGER